MPKSTGRSYGLTRRSKQYRSKFSQNGTTLPITESFIGVAPGVKREWHLRSNAVLPRVIIQLSTSNNSLTGIRRQGTHILMRLATLFMLMGTSLQATLDTRAFR